MAQTVAELIASHPDAAPAFGAPGRGWLSYGALRGLAGTTRTSLNAAGIGRGDRVVIVLPNGPEMAAAFICVAQTCVTAPLNPAYREDEFAFYLEDLGARAVILAEGYDGPVAAMGGGAVPKISGGGASAGGAMAPSCFLASLAAMRRACQATSKKQAVSIKRHED